MDKKLRDLAKFLRQMDSEEAANWLLSRHPNGTPGAGLAVSAIAHRSWKRADQVRLATHYLSNLPHASGRAYGIFTSFMTIPRFLEVIETHLPVAEERADLPFYYLIPTLRDRARTDSDRKVIKRFLGRHWRPRERP